MTENLSPLLFCCKTTPDEPIKQKKLLVLITTVNLLEAYSGRHFGKINFFLSHSVSLFGSAAGYLFDNRLTNFY